MTSVPPPRSRSASVPGPRPASDEPYYAHVKRSLDLIGKWARGDSVGAVAASIAMIREAQTEMGTDSPWTEDETERELEDLEALLREERREARRRTAPVQAPKQLPAVPEADEEVGINEPISVAPSATSAPALAPLAAAAAAAPARINNPPVVKAGKAPPPKKELRWH